VANNNWFKFQSWSCRCHYKLYFSYYHVYFHSVSIWETLATQRMGLSPPRGSCYRKFLSKFKLIAFKNLVCAICCRITFNMLHGSAWVCRWCFESKMETQTIVTHNSHTTSPYGLLCKLQFDNSDHTKTIKIFGWSWHRLGYSLLLIVIMNWK